MADVIIVAAQKSVLPVAVRRWMEFWAPQKQNLPGALVGLVNAADPRSPNDKFLRGIATISGMDYLPEVAVAIRAEVPAASPAMQQNIAALTPFIGKMDSQSSYHHWGINE